MNKVVFVLEDDNDIREVVSLILSSSGYEVEPCGTVSEFQQVIRQKKPDICVSDISLPDGDGLEVCKQIKENEQTAAVPVILMSAKLERSDLTAQHYFQDFIAKPFDICDFRRKIEKYA